MSSKFNDLFSGHSKQYACARPTYPAELFHRLVALAPSSSCAWDVGTGNGQAAAALSDYFAQVVASDPSEQQLRYAPTNARISYSVALAEKACFKENCFDLTVTAQALHWFDVDLFYEEVRRVSKPRGLLAVWCYQLFRIDPKIDRHIDHFYLETVGMFWPEQRRHVDAGYATLAFPFDEITMPSMRMRKQWDLNEVAGYLRSWSATQRFMRDRNEDPVVALTDQIAVEWGAPSCKRWVSWPICMRVGRVG